MLWQLSAPVLLTRVSRRERERAVSMLIKRNVSTWKNLFLVAVTFVSWYEDLKKRNKLFLLLPTTSLQISEVKGITLAGGREEDDKHEEEEKKELQMY